MRDEFVIVLNSSHSKRYFPDNNPSQFTVRLPHEILLQGEWSVALAEIQFPQTCSHISYFKEENWIQLKSERFPQSILESGFTNDIREHSHSGTLPILQTDISPKQSIPAGNYNTIDDILHEINELSCIKEHLKFHITRRNHVFIEKICDENIKYTIFISPSLSHILGCKSEEFLISGDEKKFEFNFPADLNYALPNNLNIYSDLCECQIIGDSQAPLMRNISYGRDNHKYGSHIFKEFVWQQFVPVQRSEFQTVEINIRDENGNPVSFDFGTLSVTLRFKRKL